MRKLELCLSFLVALLVVLALASPASSQTAVPMLINYQGELRSPATGEPVPDGFHNMVFRIYDAQFGGAPLWQGTHSDVNGNPVEVTNGILSVILGSGASNELSSSIFDGADRWLEIQVGAETLSPRQRITSVAYSLVSENSRLLGGNEASDFVIQAEGLRLETNDTSPNIIGGYGGNRVTAGAEGATIAGGGAVLMTNRVTDRYGTIGGGANNQAGDNAGTTDDAPYATVGGGFWNSARGDYATVAGGYSNDASGSSATVGGGYSNTAGDSYATVAGGDSNEASGSEATVGGGYSNSASNLAATVAGGYNNTASGSRGTVGGGRDNTASGAFATVAGGRSNLASASYATIAGGGPSDLVNPDTTRNLATDDYSTVGGGGNNQAGDNAGTTTDARYATVGGGDSNIASGSYATAPGGNSNTAAGDYSFAAGRRAKANYGGCFVWGDSTNDDIATSGPNRFMVRASGGVWFYSTPDKSTGVRLPANDSAWTTVSDRALKENIRRVDRREILRKLIQVPISRWSYKGQTPGIEHVGPMAQEFYAAFGLGDDERYISTIDPDGVALAAIQGLHEIVQEKDEEISTLKKQSAKLEARLASLEALVGTMAKEWKGAEQ
ncbi:MAG: tail fiber domain-containing protein [bacterium]|nr:tail fiber domain-containing protein [bacterium]